MTEVHFQSKNCIIIKTIVTFDRKFSPFVYFFQLAKKGLNVVLISRTLSKLEAVAKEICM